jgi:tetratricopeptide (TPR) repeat protein
MARLWRATDSVQFEQLLKEAIEVNPDDPAAFVELGNYYQDLGRRAEAQPYFESAHALDPTNISLLVNLAEIATLSGDTPAAIEYWQEVALRNERRRALAYFRIGELTYQDNNFSSALAFFQRAVEINRENGPYLLGLANTYYQLGCYDEATDAYQNILSFAKSEDVLAEAQLKLAELAVNTLESVSCRNGS